MNSTLLVLIVVAIGLLIAVSPIVAMLVLDFLRNPVEDEDDRMIDWLIMLPSYCVVTAPAGLAFALVGTIVAIFWE